MSNSSNQLGLQSSKQALLDEIEELRKKLATNEASSSFREELHQTLSGAIKIGYWEWDEITKRPAYLSEEMAAILGMSLDKLYEIYQCEEDYFPFIHPDDVQHYKDNLYVVLYSDQPRGLTHNFHYRIIRPNGEVRHVMELEYGVLKENDVITRSYGAIQDVTDHYESEQALKQSEQRYSSLFSKLPLGVLEQDWSKIKIEIDEIQAKGVDNLKQYFIDNPLLLRQLVETINITSVNEALLRIYGAKSVEEVIDNEESTDKWWNEDWANLYASEFSALGGPDRINFSEVEEARIDGSVFQTRLITSIVKGDEDSWQRVLTIVEDVSERKKYEADLIEAKTQAEKASKSKTDFLSSMSHELRTPMNAILGFAQLLQARKNDPLSEKQQHYVGRILDSGDHLMELIEQVLELNKIEAGKLSTKLNHISALGIIDESLQLVKVQAEEKEVKIVENFGRDELPMLWTDSTRLKQALLNLLSNAIKYNKKQGNVTISCEETSGQMFRICIQDTGLGIPAEKHPELFKPFDRLGREGGAIEGTGIGLTITRQVVELLGGNIGFLSEEGKGSTFWIDVPLSA